jgi:phage shock protein A
MTESMETETLSLVMTDWEGMLSILAERKEAKVSLTLQEKDRKGGGVPDSDVDDLDRLRANVDRDQTRIDGRIELAESRDETDC